MNGPRPTRIGITTGDPSGIGPEILLRILSSGKLPETIQPILYGNHRLMLRVADATGQSLPDSLDILPASRRREIPQTHRPILLDFDLPDLATIQPGQIQAACGLAAVTWIRAAATDALGGHLDAITTGPIQKSALQQAGIHHPGHTEILGELAGTAEPPIMMFWAPELVVSLATIHMAWADVPAALTRAGIGRVIRLTAEALAPSFPRPPRIGVLALNPHSGEAGRFGREEQDTISPAIQDARHNGIDAAGPLVPDTAFCPEHRKRFDAFVAMAHDQGLIPFKMLAFDHGVNVTLGLPVIRTSVDHGTAFDIAWKGVASSNSLFQALLLAARLHSQRQSSDVDLEPHPDHPDRRSKVSHPT